VSKNGQKYKLIACVLSCVICVKTYEYISQFVGIKKAQFVCRSYSDVFWATMIDSIGVIFITGPVLMIFWNILVVRTFQVEKINLTKAWVICVLGLLISMFLGR
jgi:hypothetical protein